MVKGTAELVMEHAQLTMASPGEHCPPVAAAPPLGLETRPIFEWSAALVQAAMPKGAGRRSSSVRLRCPA